MFFEKAAQGGEKNRRPQAAVPAGQAAPPPHTHPSATGMRGAAGGILQLQRKNRALFFWEPAPRPGLQLVSARELGTWFSPPASSPSAPRQAAQIGYASVPAVPRLAAPLSSRVFVFFCVFLRGPVVICFICFIEGPAVFYCALLALEASHILLPDLSAIGSGVY